MREIANERGSLQSLINLAVKKEEIADIHSSGFTGYHFTGALSWIMKTIDMVKSLQ